MCGVHVHSSTCTNLLLLPAPYCPPPTALNPKSMPSTCRHINQYANQPTHKSKENITKHYNVYIDTHHNIPTLYIKPTLPVSSIGAVKNSSCGSLGVYASSNEGVLLLQTSLSNLYISQQKTCGHMLSCTARLCEVPNMYIHLYLIRRNSKLWGKLKNCTCTRLYDFHSKVIHIE